jgi:hypothetical protein
MTANGKNFGKPTRVTGEPVVIGTHLEILAKRHPEFAEFDAEMRAVNTEVSGTELSEFEAARTQVQDRKAEVIAGFWDTHKKTVAAVKKFTNAVERLKLLESLNIAKDDSDTKRVIWELACKWVELETLGSLDHGHVEAHKLKESIAALWPVKIWEEDGEPVGVSIREVWTLDEWAKRRALAFEQRSRVVANQRGGSTAVVGERPAKPLSSMSRKNTKTTETLKFEESVHKAMTEVWNTYLLNAASNPKFKKPTKTDMYPAVLKLLNDREVAGKNKNPTTSMVKDAAAMWKRPREAPQKTIPALVPKARPYFKGDK